MTCPICGEATRVTETVAKIDVVYRRRQCVVCKYRFTTTEEESNEKMPVRPRRKK